MKPQKLIITKPTEKQETNGQMVRVSAKAYALLESLSKETGRSRSYIANKMIEFAFDRVEIREEVDEDDSGT